TNKEGIFAAGDAVLGPASVIEAVAQGNKAARSIHCYLNGIELREEEKRDIAPLPERKIEKRSRITTNFKNLQNRKYTFVEVEDGMSEEEVVQEAKRCLNCAICSECLQCVKACKPEAIDHNMKEEIEEIEVGSIILTPGFDEFDAKIKGEYGYGIYENVVTSIEFERILSASGPYQGHVKRLSDAKEPKKIAFIQCVGSRDTGCDSSYCSSVCCMYASKEAVIAKEHVPGLDTAIFFMDMRAYGKGFNEYYERAEKEYGVRYIRSMVSSIHELQKSKNLILKYIQGGEIVEEEFELVVLSVGLKPKDKIVDLASKLSIDLNDHNFCKTNLFTPVKTNREGIYVSGVFSEPKDIPETVTQSSGASACASMLLSKERGSLVKDKSYPLERDVKGEAPRIGVFICNCGINIGGYVDVPKVVEYAQSLPFVVYAEDNLFTCSQDIQEKIRKTIEEHNLNRVVVASCSPRTHEPLFQETLKESGLNAYLFEMANIRDQCSWVHMKEPQLATSKAKSLVKMAVFKVALQEPLKKVAVSVNKKALVIGGGVSGMVSSLSLSAQGYKVYLIEKEDELGGNLRHIYYTLEGDDPQEYLNMLLEKVENSNIEVFKNTQVVSFSGYVGNFKTKVKNLGTQDRELEHGVVILATGGIEHKPAEYGYGHSKNIVTQQELEKMLVNKNIYPGIENVVMIQCVGSRQEDRPYCSRICCTQAVKNALKLKELNKDMNIYILAQDIRTYGFKEDFYQKAREQGIIFIKYNKDLKPEVNMEDNLLVKVYDLTLREEIELPTDLVILSTAILPHPDNEILAPLLKTSLTADNFFLEAHPKLRPVDLANEGIFLCGLAHAPKFIDESISQSLAAASRASTILSKDKLWAGGVVSVIDGDKCAACLTCVRVCAYNVPFINEDGVAEIEAVKCQGCGACVSECPAKAIQLQNYRDDQILAKCEALFA
ncbi:MAG: FAD-dependent oxidoreductase, partial [bacterium]|nr:FAD-dependent oxidoreductase [bacterium]